MLESTLGAIPHCAGRRRDSLAEILRGLQADVGMDTRGFADGIELDVPVGGEASLGRV